MPAPPKTISYALPETADPDALVALLRERFALAESRTSTADRVAYDTADRRLRAAALELGLERARGGGSRLVLHEAGTPPLAEPAARRRRYVLEDLPPGPLRERLGPVVEMRALLPVAAVRSRVRRLGVVDGEEKTVVRLALEQAAATDRGRAPRPLAPRLHVGGVLGYDKALARVERVLRRDLGLEPATEPLADEAVRAQGGDPRGTPAKPKVGLEPGMRADAAAVALLDALAGVTEANLPGTLDDVDTEFLHQLRVSLRRARSVLREFAGVFPPAQFAHHRAELRWIQTVTGPLRDLDVQLLEWDDLTSRIAAPARADLQPLHALLVERRARELRALRRALRGKRFREEWAAWRAFLAGPLGPEADRPDAALPVEDVAARRVRKVHARMVADGGRIEDASPAEALHDLRKRGKELRYLLELFGGLFPDEVVKPMVASLKDLQEVLGRHQDRHVQADTLRALARDLAGEPGSSDALLALGVVVERLDTEQAEARAEFADRFAAFASKRQRRLVAATFGGGKPK
jgi:CHAD domain-containing protein